MRFHVFVSINNSITARDIAEDILRYNNLDDVEIELPSKETPFQRNCRFSVSSDKKERIVLDLDRYRGEPYMVKIQLSEDEESYNQDIFDKYMKIERDLRGLFCCHPYYKYADGRVKIAPVYISNSLIGKIDIGFAFNEMDPEDPNGELPLVSIDI